MLKIITGLFFCIITLNVNSSTFFMSNERLHTLMLGGTISQLEALNYIMGVTDAIVPILCVNKTITSKQLYNLVKEMIEQNPKEKNRNATDFIIYILTNEFPCKKNEQPKKDNFEDRLKKPNRPQLVI